MRTRFIAFIIGLFTTAALAAPPDISPSTQTVTISVPGTIVYPSGSALLQVFASAARATTVPWNAVTLGYETDTAKFYKATGTTAGAWSELASGGTWGGITGTLSDQADLQAALDALVPKTRTVNGHALSGDVTVTPGDLGLVIGTNVQAQNATLSAIASGTWTGASSITTVGTITSGTWSGSFGSVSGANLTTLNATNISSGTLSTARLPASVQLTSNSLNFGAFPSIVGTLPVANGGTGQTTYTNGQILIGNSTGNTLAKATLTAGTGISVTNGAGSITIATSGVQLTSGVLALGGYSGITGTLPIANGGTGQTTATGAINVLVPSQTGNSGKVLGTNGSTVSWVAASGGSALSNPHVYYVRSDGNDVTGDGSPAKPFVSAQAAYDAANAAAYQTSVIDLGIGDFAITLSADWAPWIVGVRGAGASSRFAWAQTTRLSIDARGTDEVNAAGGNGFSVHLRVDALDININTSGGSVLVDDGNSYTAGTAGELWLWGSASIEAVRANGGDGFPDNGTANGGNGNNVELAGLSSVTGALINCMAGMGSASGSSGTFVADGCDFRAATFTIDGSNISIGRCSGFGSWLPSGTTDRGGNAAY